MKGIRSMKQVEVFLDYIRYELNYSVHTVLSYRKDLLQFAEFLEKEEEADPAAVSVADVRAWVYDLSARRRLAPSSVRRKLQSLRAFYRFLQKRGDVANSPVDEVPLARQPRPLPVFIRERDMDELLDSPFDATDFVAVRNRLIVAMLYDTGMRRSELVRLKNFEISTVRRELKVHGKRNKDRVVPFCGELAELIEIYRSLRGDVGHDVFFLTEKGLPVYDKLVYNVVRDALSAVTEGKRSPHTLRHSYASAMLNHGAGINSVKDLLGHESLATTQVYTHITYSELKQNYKHAHPRALKKEVSMEVRIKSIHFDATVKLQEFIDKKMQKLARRNEAIALADVTLKVVKPETAMNKEASIKLTVPNSEDLFASKVADTFEEAVDTVIDALDRQLVKIKEKR